MTPEQWLLIGNIVTAVVCSGLFGFVLGRRRRKPTKAPVARPVTRGVCGECGDLYGDQ